MILNSIKFLSIYTVHDEIKDKHFELELGWVGKGNLNYIYLFCLKQEILKTWHVKKKLPRVDSNSCRRMSTPKPRNTPRTRCRVMTRKCKTGYYILLFFQPSKLRLHETQDATNNKHKIHKLLLLFSLYFYIYFDLMDSIVIKCNGETHSSIGHTFTKKQSF